MMKSIRKSFAALSAILLGSGLLVGGSALAANAVTLTETTGQCVIDTIEHPAVEEISHQEYRYLKTTPGQQETTHTEYRFQSRTWIENKQEFKDVENWKFVDGGTTRVNGQTIGGHWVAAPGTGYNHIPSVIINIVWGPGGVPDQYLGTGSVSLSQYGGPNVTVKYKAYAEDFSGWSAWGPWTDWSTTDPGASTDTRNVESKTVGDGNGTPDVTTYYNRSVSGTSDISAATWETEAPGDGWTQFDERKVVDTEGSAAWTENVYGECPPPNALFLSHEQKCGEVSITLRNVSPWIYPTSVKIDGVHSYGPTVDNRTDGKLNGPQKDQSATRVITFPEDSGEHTIEYRIDAGSERDLYVGTSLNEWVTLTVESDCEVEETDLPTPPPTQELAYTGSDSTPLLIAGAGAVLLGGVVTFAVAAYLRRKGD